MPPLPRKSCYLNVKRKPFGKEKWVPLLHRKLLKLTPHYLSSPFSPLCSTISKCSLFIFSFSSTNFLSHKSYLLSSPSFLAVFINHSPAFLILSHSPSARLLSIYSVFILSFSFLQRCNFKSLEKTFISYYNLNENSLGARCSFSSPSIYTVYFFNLLLFFIVVLFRLTLLIYLLFFFFFSFIAERVFSSLIQTN